MQENNMPSKPDALEPGIYFGLDPELYHGDSAISRSDIVNLLDEDFSPYDFWLQSWMNKDFVPPREETRDMKWGTQYHMLMLEPKRFNQTYRIIPGDAFADGKPIIKRDTYENMRQAIKRLRIMPQYKSSFAQGVPEVTMVCPDPETGVMLRIRVDSLTPSLIVDLKSVHSLRGKKLRWHFEEYGYHIQSAFYTKVTNRVRQMLLEGEADVFGDSPDGFLDNFLAQEASVFCLFLQRKTSPFPVRFTYLNDESQVLGENAMYEGLQRYIKLAQQYGTNQWPVSSGEVESFDMHYGFEKLQ